MKLNFALFVVPVLTLTGCSSPLLRPLTTVLFSGGGAAAGSALSHGSPFGAAGGAVAGAVASETLYQLKTKSEQRAFQTGYQQALSDETKSQYWQQQFRQAPTAAPLLRLPVPQPERVTADGVRLVPSTGFLSIHP